MKCKITKVKNIPYNAPKKEDFEVYMKCGRASVKAVIYDTCYINWFVVDEKYRSKGAGKAAYNVLEDMMRSLGCSQITLESREAAEGFWQKMGFEEQEWGMTKELEE